MLEKEMEDLLWAYPEKFLEPLKPFMRQARSAVGRADLVFEDQLGRLLVVEIKRGQLQRGAIAQVHDYFGMVKRQFPDKSVEMMVIAQTIPAERKIALEQYYIEHREIPEKRFRDVAAEVNYVFRSEQKTIENNAGNVLITSGTQSIEKRALKASSKEPHAELAAVVNAYDLEAEHDLRVKDGSAVHYRQIVPTGWKTSQIHYEFYQSNGIIGAELHVAFRNDPQKVASIAEFLKAFAGRQVANGKGELTWCQVVRHSGRGCLAASFRESSQPETVAKAMLDLISMTRSGVSDLLGI